MGRQQLGHGTKVLAKAEELVERFKQELNLGSKRGFSFLLVGRTGVGKSSTVNSLMGQDVAPTDAYQPMTSTVQPYPHTINGVKFTLVDTPGLCDELEEQGKDKEYLDLIQASVNAIDSLWYVTRLDDARVSSDEKRGIKILSEALGEGIWKHAVLIFTFAGKVEPERYHEALRRRSELLRQEIAKYAPKEATSIPSVAVDNTTDTTPDGEEWLGELYTKVFSRISKAGAAPFFLALAKDLMPVRGKTPLLAPSSASSDGGGRQQATPEPRIKLNREQEDEVKRTIDAKIIPGLAATGATIGAYFGPVGAAIGGAVGAALGLVAWLWD